MVCGLACLRRPPQFCLRLWARVYDPVPPEGAPPNFICPQRELTETPFSLSVVLRTNDIGRRGLWCPPYSAVYRRGGLSVSGISC